MNPESLNCPNCGGAVMSDRTQCEFCRSRLKSVGCPACLGLMFLGSKFCNNCGSRAAAAVILDGEKAGDCPRCRRALQLIQIDEVNVRECHKCGGFWSDPATFEDLCANSENQASVLGFISSDSHPNVHPAAISYVPCPDCGQLMNRSNFARSSGVIIDLCKQHGVWFDADELPKIIEFINKGGLSRQREKEKISIEDERRKLRDDQRLMASIERRAGVARYEDDFDANPIGKFISRLFDL
ncbi:MAG TPA: zf-TFIIB domain-containing protein [Pyrinomonadaceae bacterium]|nr:zf-TFIIB domain-containing protein [Pyrinomonadaceae bacterium]